MESLCVMKNSFYFTHQRVALRRLYQCQRRAIKHKPLKASPQSPEWMCAAECRSLSQVFVTGGADKMQMTSHALHIPGMICAFQSVCHQWKFVFLRMSQSCQGQIKQAFMKLGRLCSGEVVVIPLKTERRRVCSNPSVCNGLVSSPC